MLVSEHLFLPTMQGKPAQLFQWVGAEILRLGSHDHGVLTFIGQRPGNLQVLFTQASLSREQNGVLVSLSIMAIM